MREAKVVLLGDAGVGKSSIALRFTASQFRENQESTIGASFLSKVLMVEDEPIKFQIWDTAGQEKYHSLAPMYYRGAAAAVVVYDITNERSFETMKNWVSELKTLTQAGSIVIAVAANKCDMEEERMVKKDVGYSFADEIGAIFLETSAKDDSGVDDVFFAIAARLPSRKNDDKGPLRATSTIRLEQSSKSKDKCSC